MIQIFLTGLVLIFVPLMIIGLSIILVKTIRELHSDFTNKILGWTKDLFGMLILLVFIYGIGWVACKFLDCTPVKRELLKQGNF